MKDPVKHCPVYKTEGCAHVDGYLCKVEDCPIITNWVAGKETTIVLSEPPENNIVYPIYSGNPDHFKEPWSEEDKQHLTNLMKTFYWDNTTHELNHIKTLFIHPEKTERDKAYNRTLRARCIELGHTRYSMVQ